MIEFLTHGNFLIRIKEIKYAYLADERRITIVTEKDGKEIPFHMDYKSNYNREEAFKKLILDSGAWELNYDWEHPLVNSIHFLRRSIYEMKDDVKKLTKELSLIKKTLKIKAL